MFMNCPQCRSLVATDLATGQPPERCPRCSARLREAPEDTAAAEPAQPDAGTPAAPGQPAAAQEPATTSGATGDAAAQDAALVVALPGATPTATSRASAPKSFLHTFSSFLKTPSPEAEAATAHAVATTGADATDAGTITAKDDEAADDAPVAAEPAPPTQPPVAASGPSIAPIAPTAASRIERDEKTKPLPKSAPSFARSVAARNAARAAQGWKLPAAVAALALLLALQLLLADRERLAADAGWRPVVAAACGVLRCSLPPWREPAALVLVDRDVQAHPKKPGVLRVTATFRNDARWAQPWPRLQLTLSDINGNPVAARVFTAREYLGAAPQQPLLASGQSASIAMDVAEPAARSVAFDFALR